MEPVAVIIVNRNKREYLLRCLECVSTSTYRNLSVVVVDDASNDGSCQAVKDRYPHVHLIESKEHAGAPRIRNLGIEYALANMAPAYLLFLDNDAFVEPEAVQELVRGARQDAAAGIVAPKAYQSRPDRRLYSAGALKVNLYWGSVVDVGAGEIDRGQYDTARPIEACASFAMLVRREVIEKVGMFDEAFFPYGWEDVDFALRARRHGFEILYAPSAVVEHLGGRVGRGAVASYEAAKTRNFFLLMRRHASFMQWTCFLMVLPLRAVALLWRNIRHGEWAVCLAQLRGMYSLMVRGKARDRDEPAG